MEDKQIVALYWERSEKAIEITAQKYGNYCQTIAFNILYNFQDAAECVNDTYLKAWQAMPTNRPTLLAAFLGKITRNIALNRYKMQHTQKRGNGELQLIFDELDGCIASRSSIDTTLEEKQIATLINTFLNNVPKQQSVIFVRRYWYADSISAIATQYNISNSKVKSILYRLRLKLKSYLESEGISI